MRKVIQQELEELRHQLFEARETIEAIRTGQIDALVIDGPAGQELYTLKTADLTYRVFIEKMTEGAVTLNKDGVILYCNNQFALMVAHPLTQVIGLPFHTFIQSADTAGFDDIFRRAWSEDLKAEFLLSAGITTVPVQVSMAALSLDEGIALSLILTDLTIQKKAQQQLLNNNLRLEEMNLALERSNHDLQQFASVASHDLQEPLRKIQVFCDLLTNNDGHENKSAAYIRKITEAASRMKTLIIDVLNYSKLSSHDVQLEQIDLNKIVHEVLDDFELISRDKNAVYEIGTLPAVEAVRGQIRQVFQNIISNALKFSASQHKPLISITGTRVATAAFDSEIRADGPWCLIRIRDNGIGFEEKYMSNIFELFERLHSKDAYEGTGIGLAITKKIIEKHNGFITARSSPDQGAEFLLLLPVKQTADHEA